MRLRIIHKFFEAHNLFFLIAVFFGIILIYIVPPLWGADEPGHVARSYQISRGYFLPITDTDNFGGNIPTNLIKLENYRTFDMMDHLPNSDIRVTDPNKYYELTKEKFSTTESNYVFTARYPAFAYIGPSIGIFISRIADLNIHYTLIIARAMSLIVYILLVYLALYLVRHSSFKWMIFVVSLIPMSIYQASVVTADNITIGSSLLFMSLLVLLLTKQKCKNNIYYLLTMITTCCLLVLSKVNYLFFALAIFLVPNNRFPNNKIALILKILGFLFIFSCVIVWMVFFDVTSAPPITQRPDGLPIDKNAQIAFVLNYPLDFIRAMLKSVYISGEHYFKFMFSVEDRPSIPIAVVSTMTLVYASQIFKKELKIKLIDNIILLAIILSGIFAIFLILYVGFSTVGSRTVDGIQGRYFLPFLIPITLVVGRLIPFSVISEGKNLPIFFAIICSFLLTLQAIVYYFNTY